MKMKNCQYKSFEEMPLMLSVPEVAAALGISRAGAYELVKEKGFPALSIGARIIIPKEQFIRWIEEHTGGGNKDAKTN